MSYKSQAEELYGKEYSTLRAAAALRGIMVDKYKDDYGTYYCVSMGVYMRIVFDIDALEAALHQMGVTIARATESRPDTV